MSAYLDFYDFERPPFLNRSGGVVLATRPLRKALGFVITALRRDAPILCVTGRPGVGRSSMVRMLPGRLRDLARTARVSNPSRPWADLVGPIQQQLLLENGFALHSLVAARSLGHRLVVAVDDAERASPEFLEQIGGLIDRRGPMGELLLQAVFLVRGGGRAGAPADSPLAAWLAERSVRWGELEPIPSGEIHGYIEKRMESAGRRRQIFTKEASLEVFHHSHGVPKRINEICHAVLCEAQRRALREVDEKLVVEALAAL